MSTVDRLALLVTAAGLLAGVLVALRTRRPTQGLPVALDFWTAAGLLRLVDATWTSALAAALLVTVRHVAGYGLRAVSFELPASRRAGGPARRGRSSGRTTSD